MMGCVVCKAEFLLLIWWFGVQRIHQVAKRKGPPQRFDDLEQNRFSDNLSDFYSFFTCFLAQLISLSKQKTKNWKNSTLEKRSTIIGSFTDLLGFPKTPKSENLQFFNFFVTVLRWRFIKNTFWKQKLRSVA